eukprot:7774911-Heterocapsa_arctica.AAC.1
MSISVTGTMSASPPLESALCCCARRLSTCCARRLIVGCMYIVVPGRSTPNFLRSTAVTLPASNEFPPSPAKKLSPEEIER